MMTNNHVKTASGLWKCIIHNTYSPGHSIPHCPKCQEYEDRMRMARVVKSRLTK